MLRSCTQSTNNFFNMMLIFSRLVQYCYSQLLYFLLFDRSQLCLYQLMNFLKENKEYLLQELKGGITNSFKFTIKDLYKKDAHRVSGDIDMLDCLECGVFLSSSKCLYCGADSGQNINENVIKNWTIQRQCEKEEVSVECMILMVDLSGSMNCTYPSRYKKLNKDFVVRAMGAKNFEILRNAIGEEEVIKNFKGIQTLLQSGESIRDIAWTFKQELTRQKKLGRKNEDKKEEQLEYISRKEIIEVGIAHYINNIKTKRPNTIITVVYFNSNIEYPINGFAQCKVLGNVSEKTQEEILEAGKKAASQISLSSIQEVGDKLIANMTKAEADGQTAMTPALVFCLGLAQEWKHDLHQIVIVTDGLSNVGFGQTEEASQLQQSKLLYEQLATKYAVKSNCVVNIISFEDCSIGYDVIDEIIKRTGGVPYSIQFTDENKEKIVTSETISYLNFQMTTGFCESTKQFCFDNKLAIKASHPNIKIKVPEDMELYLKVNEKNWVSLDLGVKSVNESFYFEFYVDEDFQSEQKFDFKITVVHQYRRTKKISYIIREEIIKVRPGGKEQALQSQANVLKNEIQQKLRKKLNEDTYEDYETIAKKLQKVEVMQQIDNEILEKFNKKKAIIEEYDKNIDKINRDKRSIESRRKQTYNRRKYSQEDIFS